MIPSQRYFYFIDVLRWVAAMGILVHHYIARFPISFSDIENSNILKFVFNNAIIGSYGVWFFWCVSGFVFANMLRNSKTSFIEFSIKRFARLYPLHFLTLILVTILEFYSLSKFGNFQKQGNIYDLYHFILHLFFISEWGFQNGPSFNSVIWSVSIEIPVYFAFFYLVNFFNKNLFSYVFIFLIISKILLHLNIFNYELRACFFFFLFGAFIYLICLKFENYNKIFISLSIMGLFSWPFFKYIESLDFFKNLENLIPTTLILFGCAISFSFFIEKYYANLGKKLSFLGNSSYAIYLTHLPIQILILIMFNFGFFKISVFFSPITFFLFLFFINVISIITFNYFENPLRKKINSIYKKY